MTKDTALVVYYTKDNKCSFRALVGALETEESLDDLKIYFPESEKELFLELEKADKKHEIIILGFSFFTAQIHDTGILVKKIREKYGRRFIFIAGGAHPTGDPRSTLGLGFDLVVTGEGEETLVQLLKKIDRGEDFTTTRGIAFLDDRGEFRSTGRRPWIDLNRYPPFAARHKKFGFLEITRGCPFACYFCQTPYILGRQLRHRSVENICEHVSVMKGRNLLDFRAITPNAFSYGSLDGKKTAPARIEELLAGVKKILGPQGRIYFGSFPSEVRPEHVTGDTVGLVRKYAVNDNLVIGVQSGSQRVLDLCHRGHTVEDAYRAVELTLRAGFKAYVDFIFGLPEETLEDTQLTIKVINDFAGMGARIHAHYFMPLPQTPFAGVRTRGVNPEMKKMINRLIPKGIVFGEWEKQERIARGG